MTGIPDADAQLPKGLASLAERLLELDEALQHGQRDARRLASRVESANNHRRRLLSLTGALLRRRHADALRAIGATEFDLLELDLDTAYDGLLLSLVQAARAAGSEPDAVLLVGEAGRAGSPGLAAELLRLPIRHVPAQPAALAGAGATAALAVLDARALLEDAELAAALARCACLLVVLLSVGSRPQAETVRETAVGIIDQLAGQGFEAAHVAGAGDRIGFARKGLIAPGRSDGYSGKSA